jgi:hypothetical protein
MTGKCIKPYLWRRGGSRVGRGYLKELIKYLMVN